MGQRNNIKLCPSGAQTCALPLFCNSDLEINPMTLKVKGDLDVLKMYLHTENEAARLRHSKLLTLDKMCTAITSELKKYGNNSQGHMFPTSNHF